MVSQRHTLLSSPLPPGSSSAPIRLVHGRMEQPQVGQMDAQPISQFGMWGGERRPCLPEAVPALFLITAQVTLPHLTPAAHLRPTGQSHRTARLQEPLETGARPSHHAMGKRRPGWGATCPGTWSRQGAVWLPAQDLCTGPQHPTMFPDARGISSGPVCHLFPHSDTSSMEAGLWLPLAARSQELGTGLPPGELIIK